MSLFGGGAQGPTEAEYDAKRKLEESKLEGELAKQKTEVQQKVMDDKANAAEKERLARVNRKRTLLDASLEEDTKKTIAVL